MLHSGVTAHRFNRLGVLHLWSIGHLVRQQRCNAYVYLRLLRTWLYLTTSRPRSHLWHFWLSRDDIKCQHTLFKCCLWWCTCSWFPVSPHEYQNLQFGRPVLYFSLTQVIGCVTPSRLHQFLNLHLLLPKTHPEVLYCFAVSAHHPATLVIFTELSKLSIFFIICLVFPILLIYGNCKMAMTVSDSIHYLRKWYFILSGCRSCLFSISHIFLLLDNRCLCVLILLSCQSGLSIHIILHPLFSLFFA